MRRDVRNTRTLRTTHNGVNLNMCVDCRDYVTYTSY